MKKYRLYFTFRWKARELGWGRRSREFEAKDDRRAIRIARAGLRSKTPKISYEFEKLVRVEEITVVSKLPPKRQKRK